MLKRSLLFLVLLFSSGSATAASDVVALRTVGIDRSNSGVAGLDDELANAVSAAIASKRVKVTTKADEQSHLVTAQLTVVKETATHLEITATATVTEDGNLRFATRVGAAVELSGKLPPAKLAELAKEGTRAIGERLGQECVDWLRSQ